MKNILDQVARSAFRASYGQFRPATTQEFFALRLAARLGEASSARHFVELAESYSEGQLLVAYRRSISSHLDIARRFHAELEPLKGNSCHAASRSRLCAIRIERRAIAIAILDEDRLQLVDARQLPSSSEKAVESAARFITRRVIDKVSFPSVALEVIPNGHEKQRSLIQDVVVRALRPKAIGILESSKVDLLQAYGYPALRSRKELRTVMSDIFPALDQEPGAPWTHDAAALGLYAQTERLFNTINQSLS
jgi:hypothetical protein